MTQSNIKVKNNYTILGVMLGMNTREAQLLVEVIITADLKCLQKLQVNSRD